MERGGGRREKRGRLAGKGSGGGGEAREGSETQENSVTFLRHSGKAIRDIWLPLGV